MATFIDVKLLNSPHDRRKIGLNYLNFLGKCDMKQVVSTPIPEPSVNKASVTSKKP